MSMTIPKSVLFSVSFILGLILFGQAFSGEPIWDDLTYWFNDIVIVRPFSYLTIWTDFAWPMSVSAQKVLYTIFGEKYLAYHFLSYLLHFLNSYLLYLIGKRLNLHYAFLLFFFFLIHPTGVISVSWMIQFKTLLCFTLAFGSFLLFMKAIYKPKLFYLSFVLFALSILAKSASLMMPAVLLFFFHRKLPGKKLLILVPFFIFSLYGGYKLLRSKIAISGSHQASELISSTSKVISKAKEPKADDQSNKIEEIQKPSAVEDIQVDIPHTDEVQVLKTGSFSSIVKSLNYYFWQVILPLDNTPVKGINPDELDTSDYLHLFFLTMLILIHLPGLAITPFVSAHLMLIPFLGIITAPFMNVTWVSDQHLYLALPFFLIYWLMILEKFRCWAKPLLFILLGIFFFFKTFKATKFYQTNIAFYEASLEHNPSSVPMTYNLAMSYLKDQRVVDAKRTLKRIIGLAEEYPYLKEDKFYAQVIHLHYKLEYGL